MFSILKRRFIVLTSMEECNFLKIVTNNNWQPTFVFLLGLN